MSDRIVCAKCSAYVENCQCGANADAIHTIREITDANGAADIPFIDDAVKHCIAAAEERGRRAGYAEAVREAGNLAVVYGKDEWGDVLVKVIRNLAPRDSGPATDDYPGCGDPAHDCRDGVCGAGPVPRDSGKDLTAADPADRFAKDRK